MKKTVSSFLAILAIVVASIPAFGITWCHDYVYYVVTGKDSNGISPGKLRYELEHTYHYKLVKVLTPQIPNESSYLRARDVVIFGDAHSGIVVDNAGHIDHFLQKMDVDHPASGHAYTISQALTEYDSTYHTTLVRKGWTLPQIRDFAFQVVRGDGTVWRAHKNFATVPVEIWRKEAQTTTYTKGKQLASAVLQASKSEPTNVELFWKRERLTLCLARAFAAFGMDRPMAVTVSFATKRHMPGQLLCGASCSCSTRMSIYQN